MLKARFRPALFVGGTYKRVYYLSATRMTHSMSASLSYETEEEAWQFLESRERLKETDCVLHPNGHVLFSGVNDKHYAGMLKVFPDNVMFIRSEKKYVLKSQIVS